MKQYNVIDAMLDYSDTSLGFSREVSCFAIPGEGVISVTTNDSAGSVEFDWFTIKDKIWKLKAQNMSPKEVYMIHTHPMGYNRMSSIDINMVYGWCMALGIPIWYLIITEEEVAFYICSLNQQSKKIERELVDLSRHEYLFIDLKIITQIMYGLSKAVNLNDKIIDHVFSTVKESTLMFSLIHNWNIKRSWNQITYTE